MPSPRPTEMWVLARAVVDTRPCPECMVREGERCLNLRTYSDRFISQPHKRRYPAGNRLINAPENRRLLDG